MTHEDHFIRNPVKVLRSVAFAGMVEDARRVGLVAPHGDRYEDNPGDPHPYVGGDVHGQCAICLALFEDPRHDDFEPMTEEA